MAGTGSARARVIARHAVSFVIAFFAVVLLFSPLLARGQLLAVGDGIYESIPGFLASSQRWQPAMLAGFPIYADPNKAYWYPLRLLRYIPDGFTLYVLSGYAIAAWSMYAYMREATGSRAAGIATASTFTCGAFFVSHFGQPMIIQPAAWACVAVWSLESFLRTRRAVCLLALAGAECLELFAGQQQVAGITTALLLAYLFWNGLGKSVRATLLTYLDGSSAIVLGVASAALAWIPTLAQSTISVRAALDFTNFTTLSLPVGHLARFLVFPYAGAGGAAAIYHGQLISEESGLFTETACYVGLSAIALAFVAPASARKRLAWFWIAIAFIALVLAVGSATPLAHLTFALPGYNLFRIPGRHAFEFTLALAALSGIGVSAIASGRRFAKLLAGGVLAILVIFGLAAIDIWPSTRSLLAAPAIWIFFALFLIQAILLVVAIRFRRSASISKAVTCAAVVLGIVPFAVTSSWNDAPSEDALRVPAYALQLARRPLSAGARVYSNDVGSNDSLRPNLPLIWGVPIIDGYTPLPSLTSQIFLQIGEGGRLLDVSSPLVDAAAVRYIALPSVRQEILTAGDPFSRTMLGDFLSVDRPEAPRSLSYGLAHFERANHIALITALGASVSEAQGRTIARVTVHDTAGASETIPLRAGIETAEMAYERADVVSVVKHRRAHVYSQNGPNNFYSCELPLHLRAPIVSARIAIADSGAALNVLKVSLVNTAVNRAYPFSSQSLYYADPERFRHIGDFDGVSLFENRSALPSAWIARAIPTSGDFATASGIAAYRERLRTIDLRHDAYIFGIGSTDSAEGSVQITRDDAEHRSLAATCSRRCLLVSSMAFSTDWYASIDGKPTPLVRTDGFLQGVMVPGGRHRVDLIYDPIAGRAGIIASLTALIVLTMWLSYRHLRSS